MDRSLKLEVLRRIESLLSSRDRWCQGTVSRDHNGDKCLYYSPEAVSWCLTGALLKVCSDLGIDESPGCMNEVSDCLRALLPGGPATLLSSLNDGYVSLATVPVGLVSPDESYENVMKVVVLAIAKEEEEACT